MTKTFDLTKTGVLVGDSGATSDGSTKTRTAQSCLKKFQFQYIRKIGVPRSVNPSHFSKGSIFGACRAAWFQTKFATGDKAWLHIRHAAQKEAERSKLPMRHQDEAYALALIEEYILYWMKRPFPTPLATELPIGPIEVLPLTGSLDDLSKYPETAGETAFGECKTTSDDIPTTFRRYEFHTQTLQYQALARYDPRFVAKWGLIRHHVFDITKKPEGRSKPAFGRIAVRIEDHALEAFMQGARRLMAHANAMTWDSTPVRSYNCTYVAGRAEVDCEYKKLCMLGASGSGNYMLGDGSSLRSHRPVKGKEKMPWE